MRSRMLAAILWIAFIRVAAGQTEMINDGGFEVPNAGEWIISGAGASLATGSAALNGSGYLSMGNVTGANQAVYQTITFPTNLISAVFSFDYAVTSTDTFTNDDILSVYILDANQAILVNVGSVGNVNAVTPVTYFAATTNLSVYTGQGKLSAYAGKTVEVYFKATTDPFFGSLTAFNLDNVSMLIGTTADIPANDNFANSISLPTNSYPVKVSATNTFATRETGEPNTAGNAGGHSVWWNWTAPSVGVVTISTVGSSFTTLLGVYTGSSPTNLASIASSNSNTRGSPAQVTFGVSAGTQYQIAVDGFNGKSGTVNLSLNFSLNTRPPKVSITSPPPNQKLTNATVVVKGKATDLVDVALVQYRLENAAGTNEYQPAMGTNIWNATVTNLIPGPNTIRVRAFDVSGNVSATLTRTVDFVVVSPLTLTVSGGGTVVPHLNGRLLGIGSAFTVTAKPDPGNIFAGWTGDLTSDSAALKFRMQSNMVLQATFIPNPFTPVAGVYQGLFYDTNEVTHQGSGFINATIGRAGSYTAKILLAGVAYSIHGQLTATGAGTNFIAHSGLPTVAVQLQLDLNGGGLAGLVSNGTWTAELNAFRAGSNPPTGGYTLLLPGADGDPTLPAGDGFGTVRVDKTGKVSFSGTLGDGTVVSQHALVAQDGQWPFYVAVHGSKGSILGWLNFENDATNDIFGRVSWFKLAQQGKFYPDGFTNQLDAEGSIYNFTNGVPVLSFTDGHVGLINGNLASSFTNQVVLDSNDKVENRSANALALTIHGSSGLFNGTVVNPDTGKSIAFKGVVLEKQNFGSGLFSGTNQTGRVFFGP